ncbi:nucleoside hydrolase [Arthrobacter sp. SLBN-122]|uniref:nucleoside hydrolase n=1 Tax=Arthrobacter sp. SLBN-122 TaxID=2768455 RepID=UPI00116C0F7D|nr:nucleoside hydrolase [Arthrobacter sp. SLBN-122]TQJ34934.1 inosine-uridine preferring nucleoside hydrolase [Arthrobacter sp. SLBN-122]
MAASTELFVVDNDFGGDPDGLVALAHILLRCGPDVSVLVTTSALDPRLAARAGSDPATTASQGGQLAAELLAVMGINHIPVTTGAEAAGASGEEGSAAARTIVEMSAGCERTIILCGGPLTNVADALRLDPALAGRALLVWVGGTLADAERGEYNSDTDAASASEVAASGMPLVRIPYEEYTQMTVAVDAVKNELAAASKVGSWLAERLLDVPPFVQLGSTLTLGDSVLVPFGPGSDTLAIEPIAETVIRNQVDSAGLWEDLIHRLMTAR